MYAVTGDCMFNGGGAGENMRVSCGYELGENVVTGDCMFNGGGAGENMRVSCGYELGGNVRCSGCTEGCDGPAPGCT
jgi:hypothetical protein